MELIFVCFVFFFAFLPTSSSPSNFYPFKWKAKVKTKQVLTKREKIVIALVEYLTSEEAGQELGKSFAWPVGLILNRPAADSVPVVAGKEKVKKNGNVKVNVKKGKKEKGKEGQVNGNGNGNGKVVVEEKKLKL